MFLVFLILNFNLNYFLVSLEVSLKVELAKITRTRKWKAINRDLIIVGVEYLLASNNLTTSYKIKEYIEYLIRFINKLID
jgi:hypothetical protein